MVAALVPSVYLLARHGAAARKMGIPFAPFLAFGAIVALFAGQTLLTHIWHVLGPAKALACDADRRGRAGLAGAAV